MTVRIKFKIDNITLTDNTTLTLTLKDGSLAVRQDADNKLVPKTHLRDTAETPGGIDQSTIDSIIITGPAEELKKIARLSSLKTFLKDKVPYVTGNFEYNEEWFTMLGINYTPNGTTPATDTLDITGTTLTLPYTKFTSFDANSIVNINSYNDVANVSVDNDITPNANFSAQKSALLALEKLIDDLKDKYTTGDKKIDSITDAQINELASYQTAIAGNIKNTLYNLTVANVGGTHQYYKEQIDFWLKSLHEFKIWNEGGFTSLDEVLKVNANGFTIVSRDGGTTRPSIGIRDYDGNPVTGFGDLTNANNLVAVREALKDKKYRGFDIMIGSDQATLIPTIAGVGDENTSFLGNKFASTTSVFPYTKIQIDGFRARVGHSGLNGANVPADGVHGDGLADKETVTDRKKCLGFQIEDLNGSVCKLGLRGTNGTDALLTKIGFDIREMPNRKAAIELAFYGKDYSTPTVSTNNAGGVDLINKTPNTNLNFNEVDFLYDMKVDFTLDTTGTITGYSVSSAQKVNATKPLILKHHYDIIKMYSTCTGWSDAKYDDATARGEIDASYNAANKWAEVWEKWEGTKCSPKDEWQSDKETLQSLINATTGAEAEMTAANPVWKTQMQNTLTRINAEIKNEQIESGAGEGWKTWHKIALGGVIVTVLWIIVHFLKKNSSEEGE